MRQNVQKSEKIIVKILRLGSGLSIALMIAGLGLFLAKGGSVELQKAGFAGLHSLLAGVATLEPISIMTLGVIVLLLTPMFRVIAAVFSFLIIERDIKYALISLGVLVILAVSFFVPGFK